ncbi:MAG TPA: ATP-dependent DNA helicase, partial [Thermoanaerobaculia bacterium]
KMCANDQVICHEEYCPYARDYYAKLAGTRLLERLLAENPSLSPETIYDHARAGAVCPFEVSLELAGRVQVVVCDYNYVFDPYVSLSEFHADEDLSDTVLVVDELHNLVDRGRGYYSPVLSADAARRAAEATAAGGAPIHRRIAELCLGIADRVEEVVVEALGELPGQPLRTGDGGSRAVETALPEDELFIARRDLDAAFVDYLEFNREQRSFRADDRFVAFYFDYLRFLNGLAVSDHAFSHCAERAAPPGGRRADRTGASLRVLCKDPSRFLGAVIERTHSTIGLSATLSPPELYRDLLGFGAGRTAAVAVPSPFPAENRRVVIDDSVATTWRERPSYTRRIAERLAAFADTVPGNCLALFPSYGFLAQVAGEMPEIAKRVLVQQSGSGDGERDLILDALRRSLFGDVLLLAVAGGVFAEGVDYPGDALKAVAVVGPCLPALSLEQQLLRAFYDERFDRGFEYAYVVPGMTRVVQAAGRLIRSADDVGVIALLDRRFLERPYRDHLPADWLPPEGAGALAGDPAEAAGEFFAARAGRPKRSAGLGRIKG